MRLVPLGECSDSRAFQNILGGGRTTARFQGEISYQESIRPCHHSRDHASPISILESGDMYKAPPRNSGDMYVAPLRRGYVSPEFRFPAQIRFRGNMHKAPLRHGYGYPQNFEAANLKKGLPRGRRRSGGAVPRGGPLRRAARNPTGRARSPIPVGPGRCPAGYRRGGSWRSRRAWRGRF